jgi:hypothetical protein
LNVFWLNHREEIGSWATGSHRRSLARLAGFEDTINKAGEGSLVSQALAVSAFEPEMVVIEYGQDQLCNAGPDPTGEIELAIAILHKSAIILMPAPDLTQTPRTSVFCPFRCPAASEMETGLLNAALKEMESPRVRYMQPFENYPIMVNERDCLNPSFRAGEAKAVNVFLLNRKMSRNKNGK